MQAMEMPRGPTEKKSKNIYEGFLRLRNDMYDLRLSPELSKEQRDKALGALANNPAVAGSAPAGETHALVIPNKNLDAFRVVYGHYERGAFKPYGFNINANAISCDFQRGKVRAGDRSSATAAEINSAASEGFVVKLAK